MSESLEYIRLIINSQMFSIGIGILGIFLAIFFYFRQNREKKPIFSIKSFNLTNNFSNKLDNFELLYYGKRVENLTITKIAFWNDGNEVIRGQDIAPADPLKVTVGNKFKIFNAKILEGTAKKENQFKIIKNDESITISFDFISQNEGAILEVVHSGLSSKDINITGTIIGVGKPRQIDSFFILTGTSKINKQQLLLSVFIVIIFYIYLVMGAVTQIYISIIYIILVFLLLLIFHIYRSSEFPKHFKEFEKDF